MKFSTRKCKIKDAVGDNALVRTGKNSTGYFFTYNLRGNIWSHVGNVLDPYEIKFK